MTILMPNHWKRYKEIAALLIKYSRADLSEWDGERVPKEGEEQTDERKLMPEDLVQDIEDLGPTFVKLGQLLSTRRDLLPKPICDAFSRLQDGVAPLSFETVKEAVESSLGHQIEEVYAWFDQEPLGSASMAQVHRARLRNGEEVVVKVQRPNAHREMQRDMALLHDIAQFLEQCSELARSFDLELKVEELKRTMTDELNFLQEMQNLQSIRSNMTGFTRIVVPRVWERCCTDKVLTMEWMPGQKLTSLSGLARTDIDGEALISELTQAYLKQCLEDGLFHADPHPGNVLLQEDGKLALLDMGMVVRISPMMQRQLTRILLFLGEGAGDQVAEVMLEISTLRDDFVRHLFCERVARLVVQYHDAEWAQLNLGRLLYDIAEIAAKTGVRPPSFVLMLAKTFMHLEDLSAMLAPHYSPQQEIVDMAYTLAARQVTQHFNKGHALSSLLSTEELIESMPSRINRIFDRLANNELTFRVNAIDQKALTEVLQKIANRITTGLVLAAMIVGAAMMMRLDGVAKIFGYPVISMAVFLAACLGGGILTFQIFYRDL